MTESNAGGEAAAPSLGDVSSVVESALVALARRFSREAVPLDGFAAPEEFDNTSGWTEAQVGYLEQRLGHAGLEAQRERHAQLPLPPDLVGRGPTRELLVHVEHESKPQEWSNVFGALTKLMLLTDNPAPIAVLVLGHVKPTYRHDLLLATCQRFLLASNGTRILLLGMWVAGGRAQVVRLELAGEDATQITRLWPSPSD